MKGLLFVLSLVMAQALEQEAPPGVIRGQVQRAGTADAVAGADVTVEAARDRGTSGALSRTVHLKADQDGRFEVTALPVSYTHLRAHETPEHLVCRPLLEKKK